MSYDIGFYSNDQITGISDKNNDFIPLLNSDDNSISSLLGFPSGFQDSINSYIDKDDIMSENVYFNKNITINDSILSVKKDKKIKKKTISTKERKNKGKNVIKIKTNNFGRKKKNSKEERKHSKFFFDNILRKIKVLAVTSYFKFINKKIKYFYPNLNILKKINQKNVANAKIDFNRKYLYKSFKEIFSEDVTTKFKTIDKKYNKNIIEKLLNEKDLIKREIFVKLLNLRLIDIIKYLRGEKNNYEELNGLEFDLYTWNKITEEEEYFNCFKSNMMEVETILQNKFSRNRKNNKI